MYTELGKVDASQIYRLEPGIYLVQLAGHLSFTGSNDINEMIRRDHPAGKRAILYETTKQFTGYDHELRTLQNNPALRDTSHIGIITSNPLLRVVTASIALTLRTTTGVPMASYSSVDSALDGARKALGR
jgi:hypothetical protein